MSNWGPCEKCKIAVAIWNFTPQSEHHLSLAVGDLVCVLEEHKGWYRGYLYIYPSKRGIFPINFVKAKEHTIVSAGEEDYPIPNIDPVALEATESLYQWKNKLYQLYSFGSHQKYLQVLNYMEDVLHWRWTLTHSNVTHDKLQDIRTKLTAKIDQINQLCELPLNPRDNNGQIIDPHGTSTQEIYNIYKQRQDEIARRVPQTGWDQKKTKEPVSSKTHHLYLVVRHIDHQFPEDSEVFFFLYDNDNKRQVSERFLINAKKSSDGSRGSHSNDKPSQYYCVFTDLGKREMQSSSLYLVCQVIRKGKMLIDDKRNFSHCSFRRPYAVGVLDLRPVVEETNNQQNDDDDYQMTYILSLHICTTHETDFSTLHLSLIKKAAPKPSGKQGITVSLALKMICGDLQQLTKDFPYLINKNTFSVDKLGFPDVILPGVVRNDIYVTLEYGQFEKGSKRAERNVEVAIAVCDSRGEILKHCIVIAAGATPINEYESFIYYHHNQPKWHETFKLSIPFEKISVAHLRVGFRHVAKNEGKDKMDKTFAFAYLKIMQDNGAIIPDGTHELYVYKAEGKKWHDPSFYLAVESAKGVGGQLPSHKEKTTRGKTLSTIISIEGTPSSAGTHSVSRSQKETLFISTLTCSTKLTQKVDMLSLLKWRDRSRDLSLILYKLKEVGEETVKFLQDTLDSLFNILTEHSDPYAEIVISALVSIFNLLSDEKYKHFIPVLDIYISKHFSATLAHSDLLSYMNERLNNCGEKYGELSDLLNSMKFYFQFIIQSHKLNKQPDMKFLDSMLKCYNCMCQLLSHQESTYQGIHHLQCALLRNLPSILTDITRIHSEKHLAHVLAKMLDSIQNSHPSIAGEKMSFIAAVLESEVQLLHKKDARQALLPTIISHMISHIDHGMPVHGYRSDDIGNTGCLKCVGKILEILHSGESLSINFVDIENATPLILPLLNLSKNLQKTTNPLKVDCVVNLIGLLRVMSDKHYAMFFDSLKTVELDKDTINLESQLKTFVLDLLESVQTLIAQPPYPSHWVVLYHMQNSTLLRVFINLSKSLFTSFMNERQFIPQIWDIFFDVCVSFTTQTCLQLENFNDMLKAKLIRQFGDIRAQMCQHIVSIWHALGDKKGNFIPNLIGPFLEISLLKEKEIRQASIPLVFDVMKHELKASGNFKRVETEVFDKMDDLVSKGKGDEAYRDLFHEILMPYCQKDNQIGEAGCVFIDSVSRLIGLLLDYRNVQEDSTHRGQRMGCMLNLLNFYKEIEKEELYIRYIYKLAELHERDANFTEAGLTLLLHGNTLEWSTDLVPSEGKYQVQMAKHRKEQLYHDAITLLDQGKTWESGIPLCKELANVYETQMFDYKKLSDILRKQADFYQKIITELRVENEYFVVGYFGKGFPLFLRNKVFIHRGQPFERLQSFIKRLTDEFPSAQVLMSPDNEVKNSNGLHLQVRKVLPIPEERSEFKGLQIPDKITEYYKTNVVSKFRYDRPFHKGKKDKECEFATLWIERMTFTISSSFPGVISWFEICNNEMKELNPLDIAIETVSSKIKEIQKLTGELTANTSLNINPLSMLLKGVIDAAVMGGISHYDKIFFQPNYVEDHPEHKERVDELRQLIAEQVEVLRKGLFLHSQRISQDLMAFHLDLEMRFEGFQDIIFPERRKSKTPSKSSMTMNRPLPPTPVEEDEAPFSKTKTPHRRLTGGTPGKIQTIETKEPTKLKRSQTQRNRYISSSSFSQDKTSSSDITLNGSVSSTSSYRESSNLSHHESNTSSYRESLMSFDQPVDEAGGNYETVDFTKDRKPSLVNPPPSYPPPTPPNPESSKDKYHNYIEIDFEEDIDYQKVTPGSHVEKHSSPRHSTEFADPSILFRKRSQGRERSPSDNNVSPPRRNSLFEKFSRKGSNQPSLPPLPPLPPQPESPPPSPPLDDSRLAPFSFPKRQNSSSPLSTSNSDSEPISENLDAIRARLLKQAEESVVKELGFKGPENVKPIDNNEPLIKFDGTSKPTSQTTPTGNTIIQDDYWDHLQATKAINKIPSVEKPPPVVTPMSRDNAMSTYSLASDWQVLNSTYDVVRESMMDSTTVTSPTKKISAPPKPSPYVNRKSPTPPDTSPVKNTVSNPPPIPRKQKSVYHKVNPMKSTSNTPVLPGTPPVIPLSKGYGDNSQERPRPIPRPRSQTTIFDRKSQNYSTTNPGSRKPTSISELPSSYSSVSKEPFHSSPFSPPPRPPKPKPEPSIVPPSLPPKAKIEAPALPPKPVKTTQRDTNQPPSVPPRPSKPPSIR